MKPTEEDIAGYATLRLKMDPERDAMDRELEVDILRIIPDKIPGSYVTSLTRESKTIS